MSMDTFNADESPTAFKPLPVSLASVFGISEQFRFTEYTSPPTPTTTYQVVVNNFDLSESTFIAFFGDGNVVVEAGDSTSIPLYLGTWTPTPGATHVVDFSIDGAGIPTLFLDGVSIPLVFFANVATFTDLYPTNMIAYQGGAGEPTPGSSPLTGLFLTTGVVSPSTEFCCP